jgi:hypothetical protein
MVNADAPIPPSTLAPSDQDTLAEVARTIRDCVTALSTGGSMRWMDPLIVLDYLADLLDPVAQAQWDRPVSPETYHPLLESRT